MFNKRLLLVFITAIIVILAIYPIKTIVFDNYSFKDQVKDVSIKGNDTQVIVLNTTLNISKRKVIEYKYDLNDVMDLSNVTHITNSFNFSNDDIIKTRSSNYRKYYMNDTYKNITTLEITNDGMIRYERKRNSGITNKTNIDFLKRISFNFIDKISNNESFFLANISKLSLYQFEEENESQNSKEPEGTLIDQIDVLTFFQKIDNITCGGSYGRIIIEIYNGEVVSYLDKRIFIDKLYVVKSRNIISKKQLYNNIKNVTLNGKLLKGKISINDIELFYSYSKTIDSFLPVYDVKYEYKDRIFIKQYYANEMYAGIEIY